MELFQRRRKYLLIFLASTLSSTVVLKIASIQYLEWIFFVDLAILLVFFVRDGMQLRVFRPFLEIGQSYLIFLAAAFILSLFALQQGFSYSINEGILKSPVIITVARMAELFIDAFYMLYLASLFREDDDLCRFGALTYYWTGIVACLYSFATLPLNILFEAQLGTYSDIHRMRGFNNEGGGFGVYLLSVIVLAVPMYRREWLTLRQFRWGMVTLALALAGSQSKSAFFALALLGIISLGGFLTGVRRWIMVSGFVAALIVIASVVNLRGQLVQYTQGADHYRNVSNLRYGDASFVMGRVAGAALAPRMIAARPWLGIGWGNYPLVRDNPEYRQGTAFSLGLVDAPGLGAIDYIVDLGIPLWLYLTWISLKPVVMLRRRRANIWLVAVALIQPVSNWTGAHLNLMHPWIVVAFALGLGYRATTKRLELPDSNGPSLPLTPGHPLLS